jgi:flagellar hook-associated protein 3 FlgL
MRISTKTMFESGANRLSDLQTSLMKTQEKISANRRILSPADDPTAAARVLEVSQSQSMNTQFAENRNMATSSLNLEDSILSSVTDLITEVQSKIVEAGDGSYDGTQRRYLANDLRGRLEELVGLANTTDNDGNYMFSGFKTSNKPYSSTATGVTYDGDQGERNLQVGSVRKMSMSDSGEQVFNRISSNSLYESGAAITNTGTAKVSSLSIADVTQLTKHDYNVVYDYTTTQYTVTDLTKGTSVIIDQTGDPQTLTFDGLRMTVSGTANDGDTFVVRQTIADDADRISIQNDNGLFVTGASVNNTGSATVSPYFVADTAALTGHEYNVVYDQAGAEFHVTDLTTSVTTDIPYTGNDPETISFDGLRVTLNDTGSMDDGDTFTIRQSTVTKDGYFVSGAAVDNVGKATTSALSVANAALLTGHEYNVVFDVTGGVTTYSVYDTTLDPTMAGAPLTPPGAAAAYTSPQLISFDGLQMTITGTGANAPVDGDTFTVRQALEAGEAPAVIQNGSQSVFDMMNDLITLLEDSSTLTADAKTDLTNGLSLASANFSNVLDNILTVRASVGARLKEMESLDSAGENRDLQYADTLSDLQDLDYVKAISDLTLQKTTLDAAQQSYVKIMNLSLFQYL